MALTATDLKNARVEEIGSRLRAILNARFPGKFLNIWLGIAPQNGKSPQTLVVGIPALTVEWVKICEDSVKEQVKRLSLNAPHRLGRESRNQSKGHLAGSARGRHWLMAARGSYDEHLDELFAVALLCRLGQLTRAEGHDMLEGNPYYGGLLQNEQASFLID